MNKINLKFSNEYENLQEACLLKLGSAINNPEAEENDASLPLDEEDSVALYLAVMDRPSDYKGKVGKWEEDYHMLGKCKHIHSMIELGGAKLRKAQCTKQDIKWMKSFADRLAKGADPLTKLEKHEETAKKIRQTIAKAKPAIKNIAIGCGVTLALTALLNSKKKKKK